MECEKRKQSPLSGVLSNDHWNSKGCSRKLRQRLIRFADRIHQQILFYFELVTHTFQSLDKPFSNLFPEFRDMYIYCPAVDGNCVSPYFLEHLFAREYFSGLRGKQH